MSDRHLASLIAHEMKQPLAAIRMNAEAALRWLTVASPDPDRARQSIERIIRSTDRAAAIAGEMKDLDKPLSFARCGVDLNTLIGELLDFVSLALHRDDISVTTDFARNLAPVAGHRGQIERVLANLIANGMDAMKLVQGRRRAMHIRTQPQEDGTALVAVGDSGTGIGPTHFDCVYDPFFTTKSDGCGLGLWICRSIVEKHGGRLWATPNTPYGTVFQFTLPVAAGEDNGFVSHSKCREASGTKMWLDDRPVRYGNPSFLSKIQNISS